jgi:uroporphyrinogen decarboxylase
MWEREQEFRELMEILVETLIRYVSAQIEAGAHIIQLFDSWANHLPRSDYEKLVLPYIRVLIEELKGRYDTPIIYFFRGSASFFELAKETEADVLSLDWSVDLGRCAQETDKALQGNLDPSTLYAEEGVIVGKVLSLLDSIPRRSKYIFNLGHGLAPDMDFRKVKLLVDTVKGFGV